jgi:nucleoid-associated protein YgaU
MGLISFIKEAGAYLFGAGAGTAVAATQAKPVTTDILKQQVDILGIPVKDLKIAFADPVATVGGVVGSNSDKEKIVLALGNTPGVGKVDDQLTVEAGGAGAAAAAGPAAKMYTVKKGDTLSAIAKAEYGDANKYPVIFEANKPMLKDPNKIYPGQVLRIPPKP